jgi:transposase-like protein
MKNKPLNLKKGDTPVRACEALVIEPAKSWQRLQQAKEFFTDLEVQAHEHHQLFLNKLMEYERQTYLKYEPYQRGPERSDQANGFYKRSLTTRSGVLELRVPRSRSGRFQTHVLPRYQRRQAQVNQALREVFLLGVSTRQAGAALAPLLGESVSASTVSEVSKVLDEAVRDWHNRKLQDHYQYLLLDGVSVRIRSAGKVQRRMALCAYGVTQKGQRELIDYLLVKAEGEDTWHNLLSDLWRRGLKGKGLKLVATDGQLGLIKALGRLWPRLAQQRCWAHKLRNLENKLKASQRPCLEEAKLIYQANNGTEALKCFRKWQKHWQARAPKAVDCLADDIEELLAFFDCPKKHWRRIRTTNVIERLFVEVRRRIRKMCAFTTRSSCERILYAVFKRMNDQWTLHPLTDFTQNN